VHLPSLSGEPVFDCDLQLPLRRDRRPALTLRPQVLLAALRRLGVALGYRIVQNAQDPIGRDAAISGFRSVDPLAELRRRSRTDPPRGAFVTHPGAAAVAGAALC